MNANETPRTERAVEFLRGKPYVPAAFARGLERELNVLQGAQTTDHGSRITATPIVERLFRKKKKPAHE